MYYVTTYVIFIGIKKSLQIEKQGSFSTFRYELGNEGDCSKDLKGSLLKRTLQNGMSKNASKTFAFTKLPRSKVSNQIGCQQKCSISLKNELNAL